jgi:amidohydrolase
MKKLTLFLLAFITLASGADAQKYRKEVDQMAETLNSKVIEWRHTIHQNPELSNREFETAKMIAAHLENLGIEVQTGVAHTGVVGVLKGDKPGPVVGLRADMDALPVTERVDLPWKSTVKSTYNGQDVGVMHACGHDTHVAILMGVAELLSNMQQELAGTVKFVFQPAEEGAPRGEEGGAELMVKEGVLKNPDVDVMFGLHINSKIEVNKIGYRPKGAMASADRFEILVKGDQTHGGYPWGGVDPIVTSSQIIMGLQTIVSRNLKLIDAGAVISVGMFHSGVRNNIVPEEAKLVGTIRALDTDMQKQIHRRIREIATNVAESAGAEAEVTIDEGYPVTYNDPELTAQMLGTLKQTAGDENIFLRTAVTGAEDFSFFAREVPGFFFFLGGRPEGTDPEDAPSHHRPDFYVDDTGMQLGVRALSNLTLDYMNNKNIQSGVGR